MSILRWALFGDGTETFLHLLTNGPHVLLELFINLVELVVLYPFFRLMKKHLHRIWDEDHHIIHNVDGTISHEDDNCNE